MAKRWPSKGPAAVYRIYDADDVLLYVGAANNVKDRLSYHSGIKRWWSEAARYEAEWYDTRDDAEHAEAVAINTEGPLYNVMIPAMDGSGRATVRYDAPLIAWDSGDPQHRSRRRLSREAKEAKEQAAREASPPP